MWCSRVLRRGAVSARRSASLLSLSLQSRAARRCASVPLKAEAGDPRGMSIWVMKGVVWLERARIVSLCHACGRGLQACRWQIGCGAHRRWLLLADSWGPVKYEPTDSQRSVPISSQRRCSRQHFCRLDPQTCLSTPAMLAHRQG